ncbi:MULTISPECIES: hypothetical protein [Acidianus]|uniref:hypothetical protein n=1 Tax=Acidianus TaxID=12914 RepID=UPI00149123A1|nr:MULTISPECIES: hypothetical protein [Acidianus]NON62059.1 hypothetical protein [Acidianus sp. RZ1]
MPSLEDALILLEEVEKIINEYEPRKEDKDKLDKLLGKNMKIEAEVYVKYISV